MVSLSNGLAILHVSQYSILIQRNRKEGLCMNVKRATIMEAFNFRYACKKFDSTKTVTQEDFATILEAGRLSPAHLALNLGSFLLYETLI